MPKTEKRNALLQKQIATLNELASNLIELITNARDDWEGEQSAGIGTVIL